MSLLRPRKVTWSRLGFVALTCVALSLIGAPCLAKKREVTVPVEVGLGPAGHMIFGDMQERQALFYGARLNLEAVIDKALIKKNKKKIPKKFRKMALKLNEVRFRPFPLSLVPRTLFISPGESSMYGAMWDLIGLGTGLGPLKLSADLQFAYAYLSYGSGEGDDAEESMHLIRPALGVALHIPLQLTEAFGFDLGWRSTLMPPQEIGGSALSFSKELEGTIWHIGQAYFMLTFRIPYTTRM
jgi:hypothetical protein